ncbi:glycosyltransferase family A protein [Flavobacterium ajazii]|uniref:glycosyltransferase family A protein n=1 Tax=Flavobacterium ajazii TaxID=2692318 RepID=UPI0013D81E7F|nr:glycosyltransferase family A protein [Flavobacterium ajazii]
MRVGFNPNKDQKNEDSQYVHQIIIPVYIPSQEGYFKDSLAIFKLCLESLFASVHHQTFITVVNNGSDKIVEDYLDVLLKEKKIQELIHTQNIGKLNAILKGLAGNKIELVTISDSDVLFLKDWQNETLKVFKNIPKAGVVGIVPQFGMYKSNCSNLIWDNFFNSNFKFLPVKNKEALIQFYDSIGWDRDYNPDYLEYALGIETSNGLKVLAGSGHFVATYKKDVFENLVSYIGHKMGAGSESYLDEESLKKDYWRLTTHDNYAYHMGNVLEDWMQVQQTNTKQFIQPDFGFEKKKVINSFGYFFKNRLFTKLLSEKWFMRWFLNYKKLPKSMIEKY